EPPETTVGDSSAPAIAPMAGFADMLAAQPDAPSDALRDVRPGSPRHRPTPPETASFQAGPQAAIRRQPSVAKTPSGTPPAHRQAPSAAPPPPVARQSAPASESDPFDALIEADFNASSADRRARAPQPVAIPFPQSPQTSSGAAAEHQSVDHGSLSRQIMQRLEKYNLSAVSQLRIEVHGGVVVVAGEVPSTYERQLIGHFCQAIPGVVKFVDGTVV